MPYTMTESKSKDRERRSRKKEESDDTLNGSNVFIGNWLCKLPKYVTQYMPTDYFK